MLKLINYQTIIFSEGFETAANPYPPTGWLLEDTNGDGVYYSTYTLNMWGVYSSSTYAHNSVKSMRMESGAIVQMTGSLQLLLN